MFDSDSDEFTFSYLKKQQRAKKKYKRGDKSLPEMKSLIEEEGERSGEGPSGYTSFRKQRNHQRQDSEQDMPPGYHDLNNDATTIEIGHISANTGVIEAHIQDPEREETIKCVVSTTLFFAIVIAFFVIAFVLNPQM